MTHNAGEPRLAILATHPIQYQVPIWKAIAASGQVPIDVLYLTDHGVEPSFDEQFGRIVRWDMDLLDGYPHKFPPAEQMQRLGGFWQVRLPADFRQSLRSRKYSAILLQGWNVFACWQAIAIAKSSGCEVWLRAESNDLKPDTGLRGVLKRLVLGRFMARVDRFMPVGRANARLYKGYGADLSQSVSAPYCVDNSKFANLSKAARKKRKQLRKKWGIHDSAYCVVFVGKLIPKKRPMDLVLALKQLSIRAPEENFHALFVGTGELAAELEAATQAVAGAGDKFSSGKGSAKRLPKASFTGFLNQGEICEAYAAADCLVLPSTSEETWGLVVNEAMASGLACIVSDRCGSAEDLAAPLDAKLRYEMGNTDALADAIYHLKHNPVPAAELSEQIDKFDFRHTVSAIEKLWRKRRQQV